MLVFRRPCVYNAAMWLNNRALFPCQEYGSMSTWEACITVPSGVTALMSGDSKEQCVLQDNGTYRN